ncbi:glycosyltransferase family 2 protein [Candidatus Pacearchaeota archaeon]|nr:glycosyltransferase family 2 protein [Candidatus Pacearchaeota archaeon]
MEKFVSITIPTYNSEKTLGKTLESVKNQTYKNREIIIIDSYSKDETLNIAKKHGCKIIMCKGKLLEARIAGAKASKGEYILLLDSDQILEKTAIERAVKKMKDYDSLWFWERAHNKKKWLPSLYDADRLLVQTYWEPDDDIVLSRFFKKNLLLEAYAKIPSKYIDICAAQDHIITWYEFKNLSKRNGMIENAVEHIEPDSLIKLFKKQWRWGKTTKDFYKTGIYRELITKKDNFRKFHAKEPILSIKSFILRILRGIPYKLGFWFG